MARTSRLLTSEVVSLAEDGIAKLGKTGQVAIKLRAVIGASKCGISSCAKAFDVTKTTLISWIKQVKNNKEFIQSLSVQKGRGRKPPLNKDQELMVRQWMKEDSQITINKLKHKIGHC